MWFANGFANEATAVDASESPMISSASVLAGPVVGRRYAPSGTAVAHSARVRLARPRAPRIVLPVKITVKGAACGRVAARWRKRHP